VDKAIEAYHIAADAGSTESLAAFIDSAKLAAIEEIIEQVEV
jgi:hypothetical protein